MQQYVNLLLDTKAAFLISQQYALSREFLSEPTEHTSKNLCYAVDGRCLGYMESDNNFIDRVNNELNNKENK